MLEIFGGFRIIEDENLPKKEIPNRIHSVKKWMINKRYHARIQKKWIKRFGVNVEYSIIIIGDCLFLHPTVANTIRKAT